MNSVIPMADKDESTDMRRPMPRQPVPELDLPLAGGGRFKFSENQPELLTMILFYRGVHCPVCSRQLGELQARIADFSALGVEVVAISMDTAERANRARAEWDVNGIPLAYDLSEDKAGEFGLYISSARGDHELARFSEPALFLVNPDQTLFGASIQTMPFTRPPFDELLQGLRYVKEHGYPARGEVPA